MKMNEMKPIRKGVPLRQMGVTTKSIIRDFLKRRMKRGCFEVSSHHFEVDILEYAKFISGKTRLPSAFSREWRKIRESKSYIDFDIKNVEEIQTESAEATWKLTPIT
tara:strand:- start:1802 stop:2122 length:321 start_codon:yes stop_codon:yes gene_type:complete